MHSNERITMRRTYRKLVSSLSKDLTKPPIFSLGPLSLCFKNAFNLESFSLSAGIFGLELMLVASVLLLSFSLFMLLLSASLISLIEPFDEFRMLAVERDVNEETADDIVEIESSWLSRAFGGVGVPLFTCR